MMKTLAALLIGVFLIPAGIYAYTSPGKPAGFVNDFAQILTASERAQLESKLSALHQSTSAEVAVVTISSLGDETIETFAEKLFREWGIGNKDRDTGLLILVAPTEREVRIEVGYGLEGDVTDLQSGNIIRTVMTPAFKEGNYAAGISGAVDALTAIITNSPEAARYSQPASDTGNFDFGALFFVGIILLNVLARLLGKTKSWWLGGVLGAVAGTIIGLIWGFVFIGIGSVAALTVLGLLFDFIVSKRPSGSGGGHWPMFFGGGGHGSGGGFGGFGGGSSGGGGASGRW